MKQFKNLKKNYKIFKIFDIKFHDISFEILSKKLSSGVLVMFPAAPALVKIFNDQSYHKSLKNSDYVLFDSGYLCMLLRFLKNIHVKKLSGLKFLILFLDKLKKSKKKLFLINPSETDNKINDQYCKSIGIKTYKGYVAPHYSNNIEDEKLLKILKKLKPKYILINIGGGTQEKLGLFIKKKTKFNSSIICSGAAIAFLTGRQARIPLFIDRLFLGWFFRIIFNPKIYFNRYLDSLKLFFMIKDTNVSESYDNK